MEVGKAGALGRRAGCLSTAQGPCATKNTSTVRSGEALAERPGASQKLGGSGDGPLLARQAAHNASGMDCSTIQARGSGNLAPASPDGLAVLVRSACPRCSSPNEWVNRPGAAARRGNVRCETQGPRWNRARAAATSPALRAARQPAPARCRVPRHFVPPHSWRDEIKIPPNPCPSHPFCSRMPPLPWTARPGGQTATPEPPPPAQIALQYHIATPGTCGAPSWRCLKPRQVPQAAQLTPGPWLRPAAQSGQCQPPLSARWPPLPRAPRPCCTPSPPGTASRRAWMAGQTPAAVAGRQEGVRQGGRRPHAPAAMPRVDPARLATLALALRPLPGTHPHLFQGRELVFHKVQGGGVRVLGCQRLQHLALGLRSGAAVGAASSQRAVWVGRAGPLRRGCCACITPQTAPRPASAAPPPSTRSARAPAPTPSG